MSTLEPFEAHDVNFPLETLSSDLQHTLSEVSQAAVVRNNATESCKAQQGHYVKRGARACGLMLTRRRVRGGGREGNAKSSG